MKEETVLCEHINGFYQTWTVCDKSEGMCSSYPPIQAVSDPAIWSLFSPRIPLSLSAFSLLQCEMRGKRFVCFCNQTLTACQGKARWVKRLNAV